MDNFNKTVRYSFIKALKKPDRSNLHATLDDLEGIDSLDIDSKSISINYDTLHLTLGYIKKLIHECGYPV